MLTAEESIKIYLVLNKLIYKHGELGKDIYNKTRNPDVNNKQFIKLTELSLAIYSLLETKDNTIYEGLAYPYYGILEGQELQQYLDYLIYTYELDPVPYLDFPKNKTTYISGNVNVSGDGGEGTTLPSGGGVGFYLSKNASGQLVWSQENNIISDFNLI